MAEVRQEIAKLLDVKDFEGAFAAWADHDRRGNNPTNTTADIAERHTRHYHAWLEEVRYFFWRGAHEDAVALGTLRLFGEAPAGSKRQHQLLKSWWFSRDLADFLSSATPIVGVRITPSTVFACKAATEIAGIWALDDPPAMPPRGCTDPVVCCCSWEGVFADELPDIRDIKRRRSSKKVPRIARSAKSSRVYQPPSDVVEIVRTWKPIRGD